MNVLIVDDDPSMGLLIGATLRALASRIEVAANFKEAKEWVRRVTFDIILLDIGLPDSFAEETVTKVKEMREGGSKVIIITGQWPPKPAITPEESGADEVIYKGDADMLERLKLCVAAK